MRNIDKLLPSLGQRTQNDGYEFSIDTTIVQTLETNDYTSYTFQAQLNIPDSTKLSNYVLTLFNDDSVQEMLVSYPIISFDSELYYDMENITAIPVQGDTFSLSRTGCTDGYPVTSWEETCATYNCTLGAACEGVGDGGQWVEPYEVCTGAWVTDCLPFIDYGDSGGGGTNGGGGTGTGDSNPIGVIPLDECIVSDPTLTDGDGCPVAEDDLGTRRECRKITELLDDPLNQDFKDKLIELSSQPNLNLNKEKSVSTFENETALDERIGTDTFPSVAIQSNPTNKYKAFVHTHPNIPPGTLSVFSPADLIEIARIINNDKITGGFVAFLTTKKGTQYAITIQNPTKFVDFFYSQLFDNVSSAIATDPINALAISDRFYNSLNAFTPVYNDYFNPNLNPKIKRTDTENEEVLKEFLNFMDEANAGFTIFDASPITTGGQPFQSFRKIVLRNGEPLRKDPCN